MFEYYSLQRMQGLGYQDSNSCERRFDAVKPQVQDTEPIMTNSMAWLIQIPQLCLYT